MNRHFDARTNESGQALVMFALAIVVLLGAVGLGLDGSRLYGERRRSQAASDIASQAAAHRSCNGGTVAQAIAAGEASATTNGYTDNGTTVDVSITQVGVSGHRYRAAITSPVDATFSRVIGATTFDVSTTAEAECVPGPGGAGPGAIFAGGTCPSGKWGVDIAGSDAEIYGGVHSNASASTSGSRDLFHQAGAPDDPFTYVGTHQNSGSGNVFQDPPYPRNEGSKAWPSGWTAATITGSQDAMPASGTFLRPYWDLATTNATRFSTKVTSINKDGVYYTTSEEGMDIGSITWDASNKRTVVLVATRGPIKISVSTAGKTFDPYNDASLPKQNVLILSNETFGNDDDRCSKYSINLSGQGATWNGIMWAPGGMVEFAGSDSSAVNGTLISWSVKLSGQFIDIRYNSALFAGTPTVVLMQ